MDDLYNILVEADPDLFEGLDKSTFKQAYQGQNGLSSLYQVLGETNPDLLSGLSEEQFISAYNTQKSRGVEKNFFDLGILNNTQLGDWIDDLARSISRGNRNGDALGETLHLMMKGSKINSENLSAFVEASNRANELGQSDEMKDFLDAGGLTSLKGVYTLYKNYRTIVPELILGSGAAMFANGVTGTILVAGGAAAAPSGGASIPIALGLASGTLESLSTYAEMIREDIESRGLRFNEGSIRDLLEDKEAMDRIKRKSLTRGMTIGIIDGLTGFLSGRVGGQIAKLGLKGSEKVRKAGQALAIEMAGGSGGDFAAQVVNGEPLDITSIGLEGIAELGAGAPNIFSGYIKEVNRQRKGLDVSPAEKGETILDVDVDANEPSYKVNDETVSREQAAKIIKEQPEAIKEGLINIEVNNDKELFDELNKLRPDETQEGVESPDVQGDTNDNVETDQGTGEQEPVGSDNAADETGGEDTTQDTTNDEVVDDEEYQDFVDNIESDFEGIFDKKFRSQTVDITPEGETESLNFTVGEVTDNVKGEIDILKKIRNCLNGG